MSDDTSIERRTTTTPTVVDEPIPNPGLPPHQYRPTDVDPKAERRAALFTLGSRAAPVGRVLY